MASGRPHGWRDRSYADVASYVEAICRWGMRRVGFVDDFCWLPASHAVQKHARKRPRFDDAPTALCEQDIVLAAYDFVAEAAARATYNPEEALALIGEAEGTRGGASCERRYKVAAKARRGKPVGDWKHWRKAHRRSVQAAIAQELYERLTYHRDDDEEDKDVVT